MSTRKKTKNETRLIVAASEHDPDMLYATKFFVPDPFIFLEQNGKRTIVLSDLEIDRARKQAKADEIVSFSQVEREVQGTQKKAPPFEKVMSHFLRKRGVRSAVVPANFPLGYAEELATQKIRVRATNGLFWPEREAKSEDELRQMRRALAITEKGLARAMEVLAASKPGPGKKLTWSGRTLTSEILRAEIDSAILRAGGLPANTIVAGGDQACDPHERGFGPLKADSLIILDIFPRDATSGLLWRHDADGRSRPRQRRATPALGNGARRPGAGAEENEARRRWIETAHRSEAAFHRPRLSDGSAGRPAGWIFPRHGAWPRS